MTPLHRLDIAGLMAAYAAGETTPSAVLRAYLDRIDRLNPSLRSFVDLDRERAERAAAESDERLRTAARPLEGVPVGVKSNIAVAGLPWTAGMALFRDRVAERDAAVVQTLRQAGAIVFGTLNMHEAALGTTTDNPWFGRTLNPHGEGRTPGGSSGGSGAAVAAGLCVGALGTDTMGSVRIPAALNGIYGLKPTNGALSGDGLEPLSAAFDTIGPLARSLNDLQAFWGELSGTAAPKMASGPDRLLLLDKLGGVTCAPAVRAAYEKAAEAVPLRRTAMILPPPSAVRTAGFVAIARELSERLGTHRHSTLLSAELRWLLDYGEAATPRPELLAETRETLRAALGDDGVLLLPTATATAHAQGNRAPSGLADFAALANLAGLPALSLPAGADADGLPIGVQLIGPPGGERLLFALAARLDAMLGCYRAPPGF